MSCVFHKHSQNITKLYSYNPGQKSLRHPGKTRPKLEIYGNPLCLYDTVLVTAPLPPLLLPQAMLKMSAMILGVKGVSNQHCIGGGRGMREFARFCESVPRPVLARIVGLL